MSTTPHRTARRTVPGDGLDLAVFEQGDVGAPTVVLVHGYPDTHSVWTGVSGRLADRFHVVAYDVRGAGESGVPGTREGYDLDHLVADLGAVIEATSPDRPVHLVGHDWGSIQGWEAVTCGRLDGRIASYTSMSGPSLDHVAMWMRARRRLEPAALRALLRQGAKSWYVALFQAPVLAPTGWRTFVPRGFARYLREVEGVTAGHPAPTLATDGMRGVELYRRNIPARMRSPRQQSTDLPVLLLVAEHDRFVSPALLDGIEALAPNLVRRRAPGRHWLPAADPERFARWVTAFVERVEAGEPVDTPDLVDLR